MSASSAHDPADESALAAERSLEEQERLFIDAQVETALAAFEGSLSATDLTWMRERLREAFDDDPGLRELARAACPRDVDRSGEMLRGSRKP